MVRKIVSGGQTGVDRAALDYAIDKGISHGGWCPSGRLSETGRIPDRYHLRETETAFYVERTAMNVQDSDGTLIITRGRPSGGSAMTKHECIKQKKPYFVYNLKAKGDAYADVARWIKENKISVLNVAGPRNSKQPGIGADAYQVLTQVSAEMRKLNDLS